MKIKANEDLFNKWRWLGYRVISLSAIVQNDIELSPEDVIKWVQLVDETETLFAQLKTLTTAYLSESDK